MTLFAHNLINAIKKNTKKYDLLLLPGTTEDKKSSVVSMITVFEKFDFGSIPLEKEITKTEIKYNLPTLTQDDGSWLTTRIDLVKQDGREKFSIDGCFLSMNKQLQVHVMGNEKLIDIFKSKKMVESNFGSTITELF